MTVPDAPLPVIAWGGRDTAALTHEQIHRWVHDGADAAALEDARLRHAAHGEELRTAARRLESAHAELTAAWRGRDADAATAHIRTLAARMNGLGDAVSGQASSLASVRDALVRVQAAVGAPRPPALPTLAAAPTGLPGAPGASWDAFQSAQEEERAAQAAYRAYLEETSTAARAAPSARAVHATPGAVTAEPVAPARPGADGRGGTLARAAGAAPRRDTPAVQVPDGPSAPSGAVPTSRPPVRPSVPTGAGTSVTEQGVPDPVRSRVATPDPRATARQGASGGPPPGTSTGPSSDPEAAGARTRRGVVGRLIDRFGPGGSGRAGSPPPNVPDGWAAGAGRTGGGAVPGRPVDRTAADRVHAAQPDAAQPDAARPGAAQPDAVRTRPDAHPGAGAPGGGVVPPPAPDALLPPVLGSPGAPEGLSHAARHPEYLVESEGDDPREGRHRVAPPVLGEEDA